MRIASLFEGRVGGTLRTNAFEWINLDGRNGGQCIKGLGDPKFLPPPPVWVYLGAPFDVGGTARARGSSWAGEAGGTNLCNRGQRGGPGEEGGKVTKSIGIKTKSRESLLA